jgi:hypothetical protein
MREADWLKSIEPSAMLRRHRGLPPFDERKLRLFAAACCRRVWDCLVDDQSRAAVEAMERFVEGRESPERMAEFARGAIDAATHLGRPWEGFGSEDRSATSSAALAAGHAISGLGGGEVFRQAFPHSIGFVASLAESARAFSVSSWRDSTPSCFAAWTATGKSERLAHADLLREILGNPFRPVPFDPTWRTPDVLGLARSIDEVEDFGSLPILGDALEESGCDADEILSHCRRACGHVRGCWALDAVLGK